MLRQKMKPEYAHLASHPEPAAMSLFLLYLSRKLFLLVDKSVCVCVCVRARMHVLFSHMKGSFSYPAPPFFAAHCTRRPFHPPKRVSSFFSVAVVLRLQKQPPLVCEPAFKFSRSFCCSSCLGLDVFAHGSLHTSVRISCVYVR